MSTMGMSVTEKIGGLEVISRELSVEQVRGLVAKAPGLDLVNNHLLEDLALDDLPIFTNLTTQQIEEMLPSDLALVQENCKKANPTFFGMLARLNTARKTA